MKRERENAVEAAGSRKRSKFASVDRSSGKAVAVSQNWMELRSKLGICAKKRKEISIASEKKETTLQKLPEPSSTDSSVTKVLAMDCEMVGVGFEGKKSVLARISLVNEHGNIVYDEYVKPMEFVTDFRTHVSGIRYKDIKNGKAFATVQQEVSDLLSGRILVGHALHYDFKVLLLNHPKADTRDTSLYAPFRSEHGRPRSLQHLAALFLDAKVQDGAHSSVEDARSAMLLYQKFRSEWEKSVWKRHKKSVKQ
ncbi:RNA exonuclease 4 isoform X2 [Selaginella moellendorffii]|uniref:RNA exonuclease 4 isoform X2 n=1 Tax=Selaginella moellendorffii TaxID=88036 RepID=UPI000D1C56EC|nr:RNA exonuclease 4 isoform X2 [Selaginella moellendorffii]|eukprot:XP_024544056.1 RNA exonuclease 4 isoform X2 [Selaginella moellendorffii]